jgi:PAS domain S-box-containing protein
MNYMKKWWQGYKTYVAEVTLGSVEITRKDIDYWRNRLYKNFIMYSLPVSLIALTPAIPMGLMAGDGYLIGFDICIVILIGCIGLNPRLSLIVRKSIVSLLIYLYAIVTIANLGSFGPGVLYLLATTVFTTLILSTRLGYISVFLHLLTSIGFAVVIHAHLFVTPLIQQYTLGSWIAFSSNLIVLGIICVVLISKMINGLEGTLNQEMILQMKQKESENHYKSLFVQNPSPMWVVDRDSQRFLQVNETAIDNYGYSKEEFLEMSVQNLRLPGDKTDFADLFKLGKRYHYVTRHVYKNKQIIDIEMRCNSITVGHKQAILAIGQDVTDQQKHIKAIEEQNLKLRKIAAIQSHEVRAPLARIMGLVNLLKLNKNDKPDPAILQHLESSAQDFDSIIQNITDHTGLFDYKSA